MKQMNKCRQPFLTQFLHPRRGFSACFHFCKTKTIKFIRGGKVWNKVFFKLLLFFFIFIPSDELHLFGLTKTDMGAKTAPWALEIIF